MSSHGAADPAVSEEQLRRIESGEEHPPKPDFMSEDEWEMILSGRNPMIVRMAGTGHAGAYQEAGGEGLDSTQGGPVLVLTTKGRKTGKDVSTCLNYVQDDDDFFVVGSFAGFSAQPHWVLNLEKEPRAHLQVMGRSWPVLAHRVTGEEREQLWPSLSERFPLWNHFQRYCRREFAVYRLSPDN